MTPIAQTNDAAHAPAECPVNTTLSIIGGKWKVLIIYNLSHETRRFNELRRQLPDITQRMLTLQLRELEDDGMVHRQSFNTVPPHVEYSLTSYGRQAGEKIADLVDWLETHLAASRYLCGDQVTEADWRLFTTLVRFDPVYHTHFKCNRAWLREYPNLWGWTREMYQWPGVAGTVHFDHIVRHYHYSHATINPYRIIPINPVIDWAEPHGRDRI